ncbi:isopenicillin N synthase family oxygenase [Williamsia sp. CHRR-6]|uniref:isopenicillin N synthase family dioxygenase n=1 Tax=Williamsia sp. CHRR-6 TaxID=2835871 RepID=UPI001BD9AF93|nr:2-oxoglutarate and iron-dependent oxygenase domain-containing protein [Williamsia sp. CHRR-6]MBT0567525.1 isopenicillin N synthase family oxygenase [Williamsia sp. CHRR-6]
MLPVISLRDLDTPAARAHLEQVSSTVGFFYLVDHGVTGAVRDRITDAARAFFALPQADKDAVAMINSPHFRGYNQLGGELTNGQVDWREQIDIGPDRDAIADATGPLRLQGPNQWPAALPELRAAVTAYDAELSRVSRELLSHWAQALGAAPDFFDDAFALPATLIKLIRYPARAADDTARERDQGVGAHKDSGVLTILLVQEGSSGLQVQAGDGSWIDAPPQPDAFIVNIGEMLEVATDGRLVATRHRVITPPGSPERLSIPYFFAPALDAVMPRIADPQAPGITQDPNNPLFATYGDNTWKSRTRAHPDVFARWYRD